MIVGAKDCLAAASITSYLHLVPTVRITVSAYIGRNGLARDAS